MLPEWIAVAAAGFAAARAASGLAPRERTSLIRIVLAAGIAGGAIVALFQVRSFLPPSGARLAAGLVLLETGFHALREGLRRTARPSPPSNPQALIEVGEAAAAAILVGWVTDQLAVVAGVAATGGLAGLLAGRHAFFRRNWIALGWGLWFLGSGTLLLLGSR